MKRSMKGFSLGGARMRPIMRNMPGGKVFFRFSHVFAAVVIENNNTFAVTGDRFLQSGRGFIVFKKDKFSVKVKRRERI
jgi:hypothetical protein